MPGPLLTVNSTVLCAHAGTATAVAPNPRVLIDGQPTVLMSTPWIVGGCPFNVSGSPSPCVTAQWTVAATRVTSNGQPVVLMDSQALCAPNATPLIPVATQTRVLGT